MTKANIVHDIACKTGIDKLAVEQVVEGFMKIVKMSLAEGENVYLRGFGTFAIKRRADKKARNITKGTEVVVPAHNIPFFKPAPAFKEHAILSDYENLRDKRRADGTIEKSARLALGMERLLVKRLSEFMFAIPAKRVYSNIDNNPIRQRIADAIENVYKYSRIDTQNLKRSKKYFGCCEIATIWYTVKK